MACPRVFFDVTAGGSPVGRVIMEVSLLMFRRNLTNFLKDKSRWALQPTPCFCRFFLNFFLKITKFCFQAVFAASWSNIFANILQIHFSFLQNLTCFVCKSCWALEPTPCFCRFFQKLLVFRLCQSYMQLEPLSSILLLIFYYRFFY